jgi:hypothetical protein
VWVQVVVVAQDRGQLQAWWHGAVVAVVAEL